MNERLTPEFLLNAYAQGFFPMARSRHGRKLEWFNPDPRTILPIEAFHVPRSARKLCNRSPFHVTYSAALPEVIRACAERADGTWINDAIIALYSELWQVGYAQSVECWQGSMLIGGVYGVSLGGAFCAESMFSRESGGSKIALIALMAHLKQCGYTLCDAQFMNSHIAQFGALEISRQDYLVRLAEALHASPNPSTRFRSVSPASA